MFFRRALLLIAGVLWLGANCLAQGRAESAKRSEPNLTEEQMKEFLLKAKVIHSRHTSKGVTSPWRLTLSDGTLTHDAIFQSLDERKPIMMLADGRTVFNFVDSYHHNIAAYEIAKLIGMNEVVPVYVERKWNGEDGSIGWWLPVVMDELERIKRGQKPPDVDAWNIQMYKIRVFNELVDDTDSNLTNIVITRDWRVWRIDFSRAFGYSRDLRGPSDLAMCDRNLFEKLQKLDTTTVREKTRHHLSKGQVEALMARRDKIIAHFKKLIAKKGEAAVLY